MKKIWALALVAVLMGTAAGVLAFNDAVETPVADNEKASELPVALSGDSAAVSTTGDDIREIIQKVLDENKDKWASQLVELAKVVKAKDWAMAYEIAIPLFADIFEKLEEAFSESGDASLYLA